MNTCKACNAPSTANYCANCGQPTVIKRINGHYIKHEIEHVLHFDKGFLYSIKELLIRPGLAVKTFILEDRNRLMKPIIFIIICSLIYTVIAHFFHLGAPASSELADRSTKAKIDQWTQGHLGYANMILSAIIAFTLQLFFRKHKYNYYETMIMLCFVMGVGMLIFALFVLIEGLIHVELKTVTAIVAVGYCIWAIGQFYDGKKALSYIKALIAYSIGMLIFSGGTLLIGFIIDSLFKK